MRKLLFFFSVLFLFAETLCAQSEGEDASRSYQMSYYQGDSLYRAGNYAGAVEKLTVAVLTKKSDPELFLLRARAYIKLGDIKKAKRDLRSAQRIGNYRADLLMDSLMGRSSEQQDNQFEQDLKEYLKNTD